MLLFLVRRNPVLQFKKLIKSIIAVDVIVVNKFSDREKQFCIDVFPKINIEKLISIRAISRLTLWNDEFVIEKKPLPENSCSRESFINNTEL